MYRKLIFSLMLALCCICCSAASAEVWSDTYNATCQIRGGTDFVVAADQDNYYIITAGHNVLEQEYSRVSEKIWGYWFFNGRQSAAFWPKLLYYVYDQDYANGKVDDLAILSISRGWFRNNSVHEPTVLNLVDRGWRIKSGSQFITFGTPNQWLSGFSGTVGDVYENCFIIDPTPLRGRSGSPIVNGQGRVFGVVLSSHGHCITADRIYWLLNQNQQYRPNTHLERDSFRRLGY